MTVRGCLYDGSCSEEFGYTAEGVLTALDGLNEEKSAEVRRQASDLTMALWRDAQAAHEWRQARGLNLRRVWILLMRVLVTR